MSQPLSERDLNEIHEEIFAGRTITAIKLYRQYVAGAGLKEAKDAVEEMEKKLREESPGRFAMDKAEGGKGEAKSAGSIPGVQVGKGCFGIFVGVVLATVLTLVLAAIWVWG